MKRYKKAQDRLFEIVSYQQGFFTTKQAMEAGYADNTHTFHVKSGNWIRECRGIYRLAKYPQPERPDLILWFLWSRNRQEEPQGVYSHQTALSIHELSDVMPSKLHMTVTRAFRRNSNISNVLILHKADIHKDDIETMQGFRVTKPLRTVADLISEDSVSSDIIQQAVREALARGLISRNELKKNSRIPSTVKDKIEKIARELTL